MRAAEWRKTIEAKIASFELQAKEAHAKGEAAVRAAAAEALAFSMAAVQLQDMLDADNAPEDDVED